MNVLRVEVRWRLEWRRPGWAGGVEEGRKRGNTSKGVGSVE